MEHSRAVFRIWSAEEPHPGLFPPLKRLPLSPTLVFKSFRTTVFLLSDPIQEVSRTEGDKTLVDSPPRVLQPFLGHRAKVPGAPPNLPLPVKNTMLAAALFPEFLKELAALAQEHSILCYKILGDFEDSCC